MIVLVLFQKSEGGALGMGGAGGGGRGIGGFMSARGTANLLTRTTGVLATLFFLTTIGLAVAFKGGVDQKSILEDVAPVQSASTASEGGATSKDSKKDATLGSEDSKKTAAGTAESPDPALVNSGQPSAVTSNKKGGASSKKGEGPTPAAATSSPSATGDRAGKKTL
jgi:preprotein translocase subunit SecG